MDPLTALGAVASVAQLAATALSLSKTLYSLGAAIASASDDIQVLADDLKTFSQSLTLLSRLLEDSKSWYSDDIYLLTAKIIRDCAELYVKIDKILVKLGGHGKSSWKLRVKFVYKEGQIRKLLSRLRDMKGTLATILMSLQVDLQLSLLNISSPSKIQRPAEKPLEPETIQTLKQAQEAVEAGGFLPKYTVHSEQVLLSSEGVELSSARYEVSSQIQYSSTRGTPSARDGQPFPTLLRATDSDSTPFSNQFGVIQSLAVQPSLGFPPLIARDPEMTPFATSIKQDLCQPGHRFQKAGNMDHKRGTARDETLSTDIKMNLTRSLKSSSSTESFKSAMSVQEEDLNLARKVKAVQSVMHAFSTALEILNNLVDRRIHDKRGELYFAAKKLEDSLDNGSKAIDRAHISHFRQHGQSYIQLFTEPRSAKLQSISSNLMTEVVMKLHEYSAEHEELQKSYFEALHSSSENTCKRVLQFLNRVVHQLPVNYSLGLTDTAGLRPRQKTFTSCTECRRRRQKCDRAKDRPCNNCARRYPPVICTYESSSPRQSFDRILDRRDGHAGSGDVLTCSPDVIDSEGDSIASELTLTAEIHPQFKAWPRPNENTSPKPALPITEHTDTLYSQRPQLSRASWKPPTTPSSLPFIGYTFKRFDGSGLGNNNPSDKYLTQMLENPYGANPPQKFNPPQGMPISNAPFYYPQMSQTPQPPNGVLYSLQQGYQQPNRYTPAQYAPQGAQPMSRNFSQTSERRSALSMRLPQRGPLRSPSISQPHPLQLMPNPPPSPTSPSFIRPARTSAAIVIKRPDGEVVDVESFKPPSTLAQPHSITPVVDPTLTPLPKASIPQLKPSTMQHELTKQNDEYYYCRDVREVGARRDSVSDESGSSDYVVSRTIIRKKRRRSRSPHHKRHLAEGSLAGAGAAALRSNHRDKPGDRPEHRGRVVGSAALGAVGAEVTTRARSRSRERQDDGSRSRSRSSSPSATTGFPGAVGYYRLTAEEEEEKDVAATKQQIRSVKQEDFSSTQNALRIAFQAEETGSATLARLGAQGERISNPEKDLDLAADHDHIVEEKAKELKTLNKSLFAVHASTLFTASRRVARVQEIVEKHPGERGQRDENRSFHSEAPKSFGSLVSDGETNLEILDNFVEDQPHYIPPQKEGPVDNGTQKTNFDFVANSKEDLEDKEKLPEPLSMQLGGTRAGGGGNHALQDYQMQLMLLEQQNKRRLKIARQEQDDMMSQTDGPGGGANHALHDYQAQLIVLEQPNKKRLMMARQDQDDIMSDPGEHSPMISERGHDINLREMNKPLPHRSMHTPEMQGQVTANAAALTSSAQQRRNNLSYHRTSVACSRCRRRKIKCIPAPDGKQDRCSNCIRLKTECNFYPLEEQLQGASDREPVSTKAEMKKLEEYQLPLLTLTCGNPYQLKMVRKESEATHEVTVTAPQATDATFQFESQMNVTLATGNDVLQDFDFDSFLHQDEKRTGNDELHDFDFDSFLRQDGETIDFKLDAKATGTSGRIPSYQRRLLDQEEAVRMPADCEIDEAVIQFGAFNFKESKDEDVDRGRAALPDGLAQTEEDSSKNEPPAGEQTTSSTPRLAPITSMLHEDAPLFVNKKQFHRILKRRVARQKLEEKFKTQSLRPQKLRHGSRPMRRPKGPEGRLLSQDQIVEVLQGSRKEPTDANSTTKQASQPTNNEFSTLPRQTELATTYPALSHSQLSQLWWRAYISLCTTTSTTFRAVAEELRSELGVFATENLSDELICKRISTSIKRIGTALHDDKLKIDGMLELMEMRGNVIRVMTTVELQLGLEVATLGWSCVWTFLGVHEYVFSSSQCEIPETMQMLKTSFTNLQDIVAIIARYAVMENLYHQTGSAVSLSLKPEYQSSLVALCATVLKYFATSFELGRKLSQVNIGGKHGEEELAKRCGELVNEIKKMDRECQGFRVLVDTVKEESDDSGSEGVDVEDVSDEGWEVVETGVIGGSGGLGVD